MPENSQRVYVQDCFNITIPKAVLSPGEKINVTLLSPGETSHSTTFYHNTPITPKLSEDASNYYLYLAYQHSSPRNSIIVSFVRASSPSPSSPSSSPFSHLLNGATIIGGAVVGALALTVWGNSASSKNSGAAVFTQQPASNVTY